MLDGGDFDRLIDGFEYARLIGRYGLTSNDAEVLAVRRIQAAVDVLKDYFEISRVHPLFGGIDWGAAQL